MSLPHTPVQTEKQGGAATPRRLMPLGVVYAWAALGAAYLLLIWRGEMWITSLPRGWTDALDALVALAALTIGLVGFYREGALRAWVLGLWLATLLGGGLYAALR
ncbi:MAG: hypothetical protein KDJ14_11360 [Xanthomonadales bacterium]|nr:hypothetical protein [Xanthomonadales bacterium]